MEEGHYGALEAGHLEVIRLLINNERCNINEKDEDGQTALHKGEYLNISINYFFSNYIFYNLKHQKMDIMKLLVY